MPSASAAHPAELVLASLWRAAGLPDAALADVSLPGKDPVLPTSFQVATAAQASLGAVALAAVQLWHHRTGQRQQVRVNRAHAALECSAHFSIDGHTPDLWDTLSGLYPCGSAAGQPGFVRIHANFAHHRNVALQVLGLSGMTGLAGAAGAVGATAREARTDSKGTTSQTDADADTVSREAVSTALRQWTAPAFEQAVADAGGVVAAARRFADWDRHPQAQALASQPLVAVTPITDGHALPRTWPAITPAQQPLAGLRVLDLTRILAGPVAGRCLAAYGADVLLVNGPHLPNIAAIADTSRGKLSTQIDLRNATGRDQLHALAHQAQVFLQGYRPGALAAQGFSATALAQQHPGIVVASLSAYGDTGPWAGRRGFDSLVQTATGFNWAEADLAGSSAPKAMPVQILDYAAGHLLAFGIQAALWRQATQGGSWQVQVTLAGVAAWLRAMGQDAAGLSVTAPAIDAYLQDSPCGFTASGRTGQGTLRAVRHAPQFSVTPAQWRRPAMPPGSHAPAWPAG